MTSLPLCLQRVLTSPWRAERLHSELRDNRAKMAEMNEQLDRLLSYIDFEVESVARKEAEVKAVKACTASKAVAATMLLMLHKCALMCSTCVMCHCVELHEERCCCLVRTACR